MRFYLFAKIVFCFLIIQIYPLNLRDFKNNIVMAYKITDNCVACGTCQGECPTGAISEGDIYKIDPNVCIDCGTCADACPMGAIEPAE